MAKMSRRKQAIRAKVDPSHFYPVGEALSLLGQLSSVRFEETVDAAVNLGVDPRKADQMVRGSTVLPNGTGKEMRVAVFAQGEQAEAAQAAGADVVGMDDLAERIQGGDLNFDVVIAAPDAMRVVGKLGQILGPRGLMPNPKVGTVTQDIGQAVNNAKAGQVRYRVDKNGIIHAPIGKIGFDESALRENLQALINDLNKAKPSTSKGTYMKRITVSSTMGPGLKIDKASLSI
ncbi:MAG: 50S ribosomal protein L1 [Proteobacteria bacterium SW_6_67_9]|jgi:large subunit ribosomal protein L1|nr:MAG: 50S ribosomal protein L1 [Proteobacteria bacterium SW_6_67_9]